jgi:predicted ATPase/DNA-binding SARP family transcriptional activator
MGEGAHIEFRLLGPMEALRDGESLPLGGAKQRALLARLLLTPNEPVQADTLVEDLWGASPPASAAHSIQVYVSTLRKALGKDALVRTGGGYVAAVDPESVDALRFEALVAKARGAQPGRVGPLLREALGLWHGPALADFRYESFAQAPIAQLEEARLTALEDAFEDELATGGGAEQVAELQSLVAEHPLRERLRRQLILALYRAGRQADALDVYQETRRTLVDELGIDPSPELQELYRRVLNQDDALAAEARPKAAVQLPVSLTRLVGRTRELAELGRLVGEDDVRLVTLTGPGGTGKTRLAVALAERLAPGFDGGVWFVGLAALRDPGLVRAEIEATLGVEDGLEQFLQPRRALLVLDNFEQLVEAAGAVAALLTAAPELTVIVTSRTPLHVSGEHEYPVEPLPEADAVELFVDRARAIKPGFTANGEVKGICRRLDGLPLALELAAARVKVLSADALLTRLERRLPLLVGGARDLPERQRTLTAVIEWSHDLLDEAEQRLFARLGVFAGGFTVDSAEAVCETDLDTLASLVDKSLVRAGDGRFFLLETIREYAVERLEASGDADDVRRRHAEWFHDFVRGVDGRLNGPEQPQGLAALGSEQDNVRAAIRWALDLPAPQLALELCGDMGWFWYLRGYHQEAGVFLSEALAFGEGSDEARAKALMRFGAALDEAGEDERSIAIYGEAADLKRRLGDRPGLSAALANLGGVYAKSETALDRAREVLAESIEIAREAGDEIGIASAGCNLGIVELRLKAPDRAAPLFEEGLEIAARYGHEFGEAVCHCNLGAALVDLGEPDAAEPHTLAGLRGYYELGSEPSVIGAIEEMAGIAVWREDARRAARLFGFAEAARQARGMPATGAYDALRDPRQKARARELLGDEAYEEAAAAGALLSLDEAVAEILATAGAPQAT